MTADASHYAYAEATEEGARRRRRARREAWEALQAAYDLNLDDQEPQ